jgi:hypothetical protein
VYQFASKSDGNSPFYSIHLNFKHGGGGHLESGRSLPVLHFRLWLEDELFTLSLSLPLSLLIFAVLER